MKSNKKQSILKLWAKIFGKPKYVAILLFFAAAFYLLNAVIIEWHNLKVFGPTLYFDFLVKGVYTSISMLGFVTVIITSFLTGFLVALLFYRISNNLSSIDGKHGFVTYLGLFLGIITPGCAFCQIGLVAFFGLSSSFLLLPFKGAEIGFLAIALLIYSSIKVSLALTKKDSCELSE